MAIDAKLCLWGVLLYTVLHVLQHLWHIIFSCVCKSIEIGQVQQPALVTNGHHVGTLGLEQFQGHGEKGVQYTEWNTYYWCKKGQGCPIPRRAIREMTDK